MGKSIIVHPDGNIQEVDTPPNLREVLQGEPETFGLDFQGRSAKMYLDREAHLKGKKLNYTATCLWGAAIYGTAVIEWEA